MSRTVKWKIRLSLFGDWIPDLSRCGDQYHGRFGAEFLGLKRLWQKKDSTETSVRARLAGVPNKRSLLVGVA
jgi:hypothetical protein